MLKTSNSVARSLATVVETFQTFNLSLASAILTFSGQEPELIRKVQSGKTFIIFSFPGNDATYRALSRFNVDDCKILTFSENLKRLRAQLNSAKKQAEGGERSIK